eukprot:4600378-Prymnesium_polylepis.1
MPLSLAGKGVRWTRATDGYVRRSLETKRGMRAHGTGACAAAERGTSDTPRPKAHAADKRNVVKRTPTRSAL